MARLLWASVAPLVERGDDTWAGIVVIACIGLVICSVAIGVVVRLERSEGLEDDLDRE